jgi:hypothetical protein
MNPIVVAVVIAVVVVGVAAAAQARDQILILGFLGFLFASTMRLQLHATRSPLFGRRQ